MNICKGCRRRLTWTERRIQFGRARGRGLSEDAAKEAVPRCQKCMTVYLREAVGPPRRIPHVDLYHTPGWVLDRIKAIVPREVRENASPCSERQLQLAARLVDASSLLDLFGSAQYPGEPFRALVSEVEDPIDEEALDRFCKAYHMTAEVTGVTGRRAWERSRIIFRPILPKLSTATENRLAADYLAGYRRWAIARDNGLTIDHVSHVLKQRGIVCRDRRRQPAGAGR